MGGKIGKKQSLAFILLGVRLSIFWAEVSSLSINHGRPKRATSVLPATRTPTARATHGDVCIHYSPSFQRHVAQCNVKVLKSFEFLDQAQEAYPDAVTVPLQNCSSIAIAGGGLEESTAYATENDLNIPIHDSQVDVVIAAMPLEKSIAEMIKNTVLNSRWTGFTPERIRSNFQHFRSMLESKLQLGSAVMTVVNYFPQVLLYDCRQVEDRLNFLLAPLPPLLDHDDSDWPLLAFQGYGAGWSVNQVKQALQTVPHVVLSMYLEDTFSMRPSLLYLITALQVPYQSVDRVRLELEDVGSDEYTFAYLHGTLGLTWEQLHVMIQAFPCLSVGNTEPTWEMLETNVRSVLREDALHYLQRRLQVGPSTVEAMIKTHPRLSTYSVEGKIRQTLDALQAKLGFSSSEIRQVILRMPSLIGMSVIDTPEKGLSQRLVFFRNNVGMSQQELRMAVLKQPSLLQYSVENSLRPKLDFFVDEVHIPLTDMPRVISRYPVLMGLSLNETLRPKGTALMERCGLSPKEIGNVLSRAPNILSLSLKRNLEPTLDYLCDRLGLSKRQLKKLIISTPRVLLHSVKTSLEPKLLMLEAAMETKDPIEARNMVIRNPALLVLHISALQRRLQKKELQPQSRRLTRRKRPVLEVDPEKNVLIRRYASASEASKMLRTSLPNLYSILGTGRVWKGKKLMYAEKLQKGELIEPPTRQLRPYKILKARPMPTKHLMFEDLNTLNTSNESSPDTDMSLSIVVYVSGRTYPPDSSAEVRGIRRTGGMALKFPHFHQDKPEEELAHRIRLAAKKSFGQIMPLNDDGQGTCYSEGRILVGFPYLRPSRNRCELYACHEALKIVGNLLKQESSLENETVQVQICTDSDYAWNLLSNTSRLHAWGSVAENDFIYDGPGSSWRANPDLLHPLSRTYYRLVEQIDSDNVTQLMLAKQVNVTFRHAAGCLPRKLQEYAKQAALWMNQRARTAIKL